MKQLLAISLLSLFGLFVISGCNTLRGSDAAKDYNEDPLTVSVASGMPTAEVTTLMNQVFQGRDWTVISSEPGRVVAELNHRGFKAQATMVQTGDKIQILSNSEYLSPKSGEYSAAVPYGWLENLQKDLNRMMARSVYN
ncbi:MAG: hypothetical protein AAFX93_16900 [Verrucomicrobiota bacterium]